MRKIVVLGNGIDWLDSCYEKQQKNIVFINKKIPISTKSKVINYIIRVFFSIRDKNKNVIKLPFRNIWYRFSEFTKRIDSKDEIYFFIYDHNRLSTDELYIKWLRKKYKNSKISFVFTNIVEKSGAKQYGIVNKLNQIYDNVFAFDEQDSKKYNFKYNYLIYEPIITQISNIEYDLFFVGNAKERLNKLHEIYLKAKELGLKTCFYINGVDEKNQLKESEIIYNKRISYKDSLELLKKSKCMIDILQDGSQGIVLRICEAILWNKLIITDNKALEKEDFFDKDSMLILNNVNDITYEFVNRIPNINNENKKYFEFEKILNQV